MDTSQHVWPSLPIVAILKGEKNELQKLEPYQQMNGHIIAVNEGPPGTIMN